MGLNVYVFIKWFKEYVFVGYYSDFFYMMIVGVILIFDFISVVLGE